MGACDSPISTAFTEHDAPILIGLAAKNAILIMEFAAQNRKAGMSAHDAAVTSGRQRFRPIMMTALTFIIGSLHCSSPPARARPAAGRSGLSSSAG